MQLIICCLAFLAAVHAQPSGEPVAPWPMFGKRASRISRSDIAVPVDGTTRLVWSMPLSQGSVTTQVVTDLDDAHYVGTQNGLLAKIDRDGRMVWNRTETSGPITSTPSVLGRSGDGGDGGSYSEYDFVYYGTHDGYFHQRFALNGTDIAEPFNCGGPIVSAIITRPHVATAGVTAYVPAGNRLLGLDVFANQERFLLDEWPEGTVLSDATYGFCTLIMTASDGSIINLNPHRFPGYPVDEEDEFCQDFPATKWSASSSGYGSAMGSLTNSIPLFGRNDVVLGTTAGTVESFNMDTGEMNWVVQLTSEPVTAHPTFSGSRNMEGVQIFIGGHDGFLYSLSPDDGSENWRFDTGAPILHGAATDQPGRTVFVASSSAGRLFAVSAADGAEVGRWDSPAPITNAPSITGRGEVVVGDEDGAVHVVSFGCPGDTLGDCVETSCAADGGASSCTLNCKRRC